MCSTDVLKQNRSQVLKMYMFGICVCIVAAVKTSDASRFLLRSNVPEQRTARLLTYNAALLPRIGQYQQRRTETAEAIKNTNADVVCLQEVWLSDDLRNILVEINKDILYPYSYSALHTEAGDLPPPPNSAPCRNYNFTSVLYPCVIERCSRYSSDPGQALRCAINDCNLFDVLDQQCISCLVKAGLDVTRITELCVNARGRQMNEPGLLLLSKLPMTKVCLVRYEDDRKLFNPRAYILAKISGIGTVVCTHATPNQEQYAENLPQYTSAASQNFAEVRKLVNAIRWERNVVILGDTNASPSLPGYNIVGELEESYWLLVRSGYRPVHYQTNNRCTYCLDNPLADKTGNKIVDHVFLKGIYLVRARRVMDSFLPGQAFPLSDHYGVEATVITNTC